MTMKDAESKTLETSRKVQSRDLFVVGTFGFGGTLA